MCLLREEDGEDFSKAKVWYQTDLKKAIGTFFNGNIVGIEHPSYKTEEERYDNISAYFIKEIVKAGFDVPYIHQIIAIEDYSFGSKGRVFNIAENTGLLKHKIWKASLDIHVVAPTRVKKFATGSGAAKKEDMYETFVKDTGVDLNNIMFPDRKLASPVTDIVDAYYIAKYIRIQFCGGSANANTATTGRT